MFAPLVFICLAAISATASATRNTVELGKVIDLRDTDLLSDFQEQEITIFEPLDPKCFIDEKKAIQSSRKFMQYYASRNAFFSSLATQLELSASLQSSYTLGVSLNVATKSESSKENKVSGLSLNALAITEKILVRRGCLEGDEANLTKEFLEDVELLPMAIKDPWEGNSWEAYNSFLKKYGSHIINSVTHGSSFRQMTFAQSSKSYSERDFEVKSCISLGGPTSGGEVGFEVCANISKKERSEASSMDASDKVFVLGGNPETRNKLLDQETRTVEEIQKLLTEAKQSPASIDHTLFAVWDMLQARFEPGSPNHVRGLNMEFYFLGFLNHGCSYVTGGGVAIQKFDHTRFSTTASPEFECSLAKQGCHRDADCHYKAVWCSCHGDSCVRYKSVTECDGAKRETAYANKDVNWGWSGCGWKVAGSWCACYNSDRNWRKVVWSRPSKDAPTHEVNHHEHHGKTKDPAHRKPKGKKERN